MRQTQRLVAMVLTLLSLAVLPCSLRADTSSGSLPVFPLDPARYTDPAQYAFLGPVLKDVEVVSLGESIHLTHEFPLVRIGMVKYLNENMGFHLLAMEGSAEDVWVAQDRLLHSKGTEADAADAQLGLFRLWNTPEMKQLLEYEAASWKTPNPLYIASYDIQPGTGKGSNGAGIYGLLADRLLAYAAPPPGFDFRQWSGELEPLAQACGGYQASQDAKIEVGIAMTEAWIGRAAPVVEKTFPNVPHAAVLRLIPDNLRASLRLCQGLRSGNGAGYKAVRDTNAAPFALELKAAAPGQKLMLWAHVSHVFYDDEGYGASVGQILHKTLGPRLYTLAPFAESGVAIMIFQDFGGEDIAYALVHGRRGESGKTLSRLCRQDCFVDFRSAGALVSDPAFATRQVVYAEGGHGGYLALALARDFDGIVWIKSVHPADLPRGIFLLMSLYHYRFGLLSAGSAAAGGVVALLLVWRRRLRREHGNRRRA